MLPPQPTCYTAQNNAEGSSADALVMRLIGLAKTRIVRENGHNNNRSYYGAREEFLSFEFQLASFGGKAAAGSHNFTFSLVLPPGLPSSMKVSGHGLGSLLCAFVRAAPLDEERLEIDCYTLPAGNPSLDIYQLGYWLHNVCAEVGGIFIALP